MNLFNRLIGILLAFLILTTGGLALAGVLQGLPRELLDRVPELAQQATWLAVGGAAAVFAGLALLVLELRPTRPDRGLLLRRDKLGEISVSMTGLRRLADHVVSSIPGVEAVISEARRTRNGLAFDCRVVVKPESSTPELAQEIRSRLGAAVQHHVGQPVAQIDVRTQVDSTALARRRVR